jgi:tRNA (adenine37-N6)-methyltransferase
MTEMQLQAIGTIHSPFTATSGTPIQPRFSTAEGSVELFEPYAAALADLAGFDRIWLLYWFDRTSPARVTVTPFMDDTLRGLFATRAPCRPNPIGMSCVQILGVDGRTLRVGQIDILDNTPLLDIKPYAPRFDHLPADRSGWLDAIPPPRTTADDRFADEKSTRDS